ncbi:MAG: ABC transporter substrate-binding protein [Deinococcaceae bacterium]
MCRFFKIVFCSLFFGSVGLARTVTDDLGRTVVIPDLPKRVAPLSPYLVETLYTLGVTPVARPSSVTYPNEAQTLLDVGLSYKPNLERLLSTQPDLVLIDALTQAQLVPSIEKLGVSVVAMDSRSLNDVYRVVGRLGLWLGREQKAKGVERNIRIAVSKSRAKVQSKPARVFILIGSPQGFFGAKKNSFVGNLLDAVGALNVATGPDDQRYQGFAPYTFEGLLKANPDVLIVVKPNADPAEAGRSLAAFSKNPLWNNLKAVKAKRIYELSPEIVLSSPGPRAAEALSELSNLIYPR